MRWLTALVLTVALPLSGCSEPSQTVEEGGITVLIAGSMNGASDVRLVGTLRAIDGCLNLELEENRWVAVFPEGSEVADDGQTVTLSDGSALRVGDFIEAGGETYKPNDPPGNAPAVPERCGNVSAALLTDPRVAE